MFMFLLLVTSTHAGEGDGGQAGAFFQIPIGARPTAMGGAYIGLSDDGAGPLFNPAGLSDLKHTLLASSYRAMQLDRVLSYVTFMAPAKGNSAVGINWLYSGAGSVVARDDAGFELGHDITFNNHAIGIVFAKRFEEYLSVGAKFSYMQASMPEITAFTVGVDLGLMLHVNYLWNRERRDQIPIKDIRIGLVFKHLAAQYNWNSENYLRQYVGANSFGTTQNDKIPLDVGLGGSARFLERKLVLAADVLKNESQGIRFHSGAEYFVRPEFALRGGFSRDHFTAGSGFIFELGKHALAIDYAFAADRVEEGSEHIFSFEFLF